MAGRIAGALLALLVLVGVGVVVGYDVADDEAAVPTRFASPVAVPAESPSYPVNVYDIEPDPDTAPLGTDLVLEEQGFRSGGFRLRAPVPVGWQRVAIAGGDRWQFTEVGTPPNTYLLRIEILAADTQSPAVKARSRMFALSQQEADGNAENLIFEEDTGTGFTYTEIDAGGYQRVGIERFVAFPGNSSAYYTVAIAGREVDREGMADLVEEIVAEAYVP